MNFSTLTTAFCLLLPNLALAATGDSSHNPAEFNVCDFFLKSSKVGANSAKIQRLANSGFSDLHDTVFYVGITHADLQELMLSGHISPKPFHGPVQVTASHPHGVQFLKQVLKTPEESWEEDRNLGPEASQFGALAIAAEKSRIEVLMKNFADAKALTPNISEHFEDLAFQVSSAVHLRSNGEQGVSLSFADIEEVISEWDLFASEGDPMAAKIQHLCKALKVDPNGIYKKGSPTQKAVLALFSNLPFKEGFVIGVKGSGLAHLTPLDRYYERLTGTIQLDEITGIKGISDRSNAYLQSQLPKK